MANEDTEAIGATVTMGVAAVMTHQVGKSVGVKTEGTPHVNKQYAPRDKVTGELIKTEKTKAGNTKIDAEARGKAHTQLRTDESGNYVQRTTFDSKGRKRADTHFTTHGESGKSNPHKQTYYKDGRRQKQTP